MIRRFSVLAYLTGLLMVSQPFAGQQGAIDFSELDRTVNEELKATNTPGAAVAVVIGNRVAYAKGFGVSSIETGAPVTPDTLFRIASSTKMLTAAAAVMLAEQGHVRLHSPIGQHVPGLSPKLAALTLHQLLSHTAGLRDGFSFFGPHDDEALAGFVRTWTDDWLIAQPGEVFSYSNFGPILAARVLEGATGKPYADVMKDVLFEPLGMRRTTLRPLMAMTYPLAQGHDVPSGQANAAIVRPFADDVRYWAAGGVLTSVSDFSRFAIALVNGGTLEGRQVLPPAAVAKMSTAYVDVPGGNVTEHPRHAYGLNVRDHRGVRVLQHGGLRIGFGSLVRLVPEHRVAVIILTNRSNTLFLKAFETATALAVPLGAQASAPSREPIAMTEVEMGRYAGTYQNAPDYLTVELFVREGKLFLRQIGQTGVTEVVKTGEHIFNAGGQEFLLILGADGTPRYMHIAAHALRRM